MIINGWTLYFHPLFLDRMETLLTGVARERKKHPADHTMRSNAKLLNAIRTITRVRIPQDPTDKRYPVFADWGVFDGSTSAGSMA